MNSSRESLQAGCTGALLALVTALLYSQVGGFEFVNYDDPLMILDNPIVRDGLTWAGIHWAFTTHYFEYWHPLTWLSHMLDCQWFGLRAGGHHLVSAGWHVANTVLVFAVLRRLTGRLARSAVVAGLFALHPMHVESVAWVAERKDVLSAFFWLASLWAYARYAEGRAAKSQKSESGGPAPACRFWTSGFYWLALAGFAAGLMSKPMVVTLPFVLLLLDFWPLRRWTPEQAGRQLGPLLLEKVPFLALMLASMAVTVLSVDAVGKVLPAETYPWSLRLANIPVAYVKYLGKLAWPQDLAVFYPLAREWTWPPVAGTLAVVLGLSAWVIWRARSAPYLLFGWLLFLGTLVPTIGIVPVGYQAIADRYTYVPAIGLFVAVVWAVAEASRRWPARRLVLGGVAGAVLLACAVGTGRQLQHWRDSIALWSHCLAVTRNNIIAHSNLGWAYFQAGRLEEAEAQYRQGLSLTTDFLDLNLNLGAALLAGGRFAEATNYFAAARNLKPDSARAHLGLGEANFALGNSPAAASHFEEAIRLESDNPRALAGLGRVLSSQGRFEEARSYYERAAQSDRLFSLAHYHLGQDYSSRRQWAEAAASFEEVLRRDPSAADAHAQLAAILARKGRTADAVTRYREALRLKPDAPEVLNNVAWMLATHPSAEFRDGATAVQLAERARRLTSDRQPVIIGTLAAAYAEAGRFTDAVAAGEQAHALAESLGRREVAERNAQLLELYRNRRAFHEPE